MFEPLPAQFSFPEAEQRILEFWEQHNIFQKSLDQRRAAPRFVFYEGPPTANGMPHPGHCLTRSIKDLFRATRPCAANSSSATPFAVRMNLPRS